MQPPNLTYEERMRLLAEMLFECAVWCVQNPDKIQATFDSLTLEEQTALVYGVSSLESKE